MEEKPSNFRAFAMLGLVMLLWAGNSIVGRAVRADVPPFTLAFGRWLLALMVLLPFALAPLRREWRAVLTGWRWIVVLGVLGVVCFNGFLYKGLHYTTAANALLLQASIPAAVTVLDRVLFGGRPGKLHVLGVVVSTLGVMAIVFKGDPAALMQLRFGPGDSLIFCAVAAWSFYTVLLRKRPPVSPVVFLFLTFALGAIGMAPLAALEAASGQAVRWSPHVLAAFAYVGLFPSAIAYFIYNRATAELGAARAGQAITLMPLFGALLSALLLGERLMPYHFAGMALILAGIVLSALALRRVRANATA
ncbi:drug/metabolite transporter (DMT)-like permease [Novosphingobium sp. PhB165]|uniref:DMT family transporter n=1 Tax=Novosphingobium sp. PhB165 TaxID=2485105 RepID=UPI00104D60B5|nr:DMT family transporter [Novosphingobium sp. PhB165]TCM18952.1 drug/metabolite transporter (DMT)-like permease [Novosphingobium sp. PhB165]